MTGDPAGMKPDYEGKTRDAVVWEISMLISIFQGMADAAGPNVGAEMARIILPTLEARRRIVLGLSPVGKGA